MTDEQIMALKALVQTKPVYWNNGDGACMRVSRVSLDWVEDKEEPDLSEPAAFLGSGGVVALYNVEASSFVVLTPCFSE